MKNLETKTLQLEPKIIFLGTPEIAADILQKIAGEINIAAVVTQPDKPQGRSGKLVSPPVKQLAEELNIPTFQARNKEELTEYIKSEKPDLLIVAAFGMILPKTLLEVPRFGSLNVHPSLLPKYRGPAPLEAAILNGDSETGVSIMELTEEMDAGPILEQQEIELSETETLKELEKKAANLGAEMLLSLVPKWLKGEIFTHPQDAPATYTKMIKKEDGRIDFSTETAEEIERKSRAYAEWPGIYTFWNGKKLDFKDIAIESGALEPGQVSAENNKILIGTKKNSIIPGSLKLEGKNWVGSPEFLRGYQSIESAKFE